MTGSSHFPQEVRSVFMQEKLHFPKDSAVCSNKTGFLESFRIWDSGRHTDETCCVPSIPIPQKEKKHFFFQAVSDRFLTNWCILIMTHAIEY